ncbi:MAG: hypothetical protein ACN4E2_05255 [Nitrospinota bacterium]
MILEKIILIVVIGFSLDPVYENNVKGNLAFQSENYREAISCYQAAIELSDGNNNSYFHHNIGNVLYKEKMYELAIESYDRTNRIGKDEMDGSFTNLNYVAATIKSGDSYSSSNSDMAIQFYEMAVETALVALRYNRTDLKMLINLEIATYKLQRLLTKKSRRDQKNRDEDNQGSDGRADSSNENQVGRYDSSKATNQSNEMADELEYNIINNILDAAEKEQLRYRKAKRNLSRNRITNKTDKDW